MKTYMGVRLRRLREERQMNQVAAARAIGLSASYYNQLENDERPLTVPVLLKVAATFGGDVQVPPKNRASSEPVSSTYPPKRRVVMLP